MPIYHDIDQNTPEWTALRLGIPTASEFLKLITPKTMTASSQAPALMFRLLAEWMTGEYVEGYQSEHMQRGQEMQDKAVAAYEMLTDTETSRGGFVMTDDQLSGCSPDRLVGKTAGVEIKCRLIHTQIEHVLSNSIADAAKCQIQGCLMITEREWWDAFSYHPNLIVRPVRVYRDEKFIAALSAVLATFKEIMLQKRAELEQRFGPFRRPEPKAAEDYGGLGLTDEDLAAWMADAEAKHSTKGAM